MDHVFQDGNKRTAFLVAVYALEKNKKIFDKEQLLTVMRKIAKNNLTNPIKISRLIYHVIREEN